MTQVGGTDVRFLAKPGLFRACGSNSRASPDFERALTWLLSHCDWPSLQKPLNKPVKHPQSSSHSLGDGVAQGEDCTGCIVWQHSQRT